MQGTIYNMGTVVGGTGGVAYYEDPDTYYSIPESQRQQLNELVVLEEDTDILLTGDQIAYDDDNTVTDVISSLNDTTTNMFKICKYTYSQVTVNANSEATLHPTSNNIPSGYKSVAFSEYTTGSMSCLYRYMDIMDGTIVIKNITSTSTQATPRLTILCVREDCLQNLN